MTLLPARLTACLLLLAALPACRCQTPAATPALPDAPRAIPSGAVHGQLLYPDGAPFPSGELTLTPAAGPALRATTDPDGTFLFVAVPPGPFTLQAAGDGVEPAALSGSLAPSSTLELAPFALRLSTVVTTVSAISPEELAESQVRAEEHQRLFGAIPNFFVSYDPRTVPLSPAQKFRLSARTLFDPTNIALAGFVAGGEQTVGMYHGFPPGATGFAERFGASFTDGATQIMLAGALLPSILHQDPRYFYQGTGSRRSRLGNVLRQAIEQKGDNGRWQFAWSNTFGDVGSALISTTYYPAPGPGQVRSLGALTATNFGLGLGSQVVANFLQEFVFARLTSHTQP